MNSLNINISKVCRSCLEQKDDLISLYSVDNITGIQLCEMILQITSQVQVMLINIFLYFVDIYILSFFRFLQKKMHHRQYVQNAITNSA